MDSLPLARLLKTLMSRRSQALQAQNIRDPGYQDDLQIYLLDYHHIWGLKGRQIGILYGALIPPALAVYLEEDELLLIPGITEENLSVFVDGLRRAKSQVQSETSQKEE